MNNNKYKKAYDISNINKPNRKILPYCYTSVNGLEFCVLNRDYEKCKPNVLFQKNPFLIENIWWNINEDILSGFMYDDGLESRYDYFKRLRRLETYIM